MPGNLDVAERGASYGRPVTNLMTNPWETPRSLPIIRQNRSRCQLRLLTTQRLVCSLLDLLGRQGGGEGSPQIITFFVSGAIPRSCRDRDTLSTQDDEKLRDHRNRHLRPEWIDGRRCSWT